MMQVLVNLMFVVYGSFMYGLQRLCFGPLRPTEIEQLYEKAWFAVTETCLAMTIFREEVGAFFLIMFTALVTGKVWGWIGEGRVEVLEQQPPANPRLFHTRLGISLLVSIAYDIWLLNYAVNTVVQNAKPTMMVMFLFEFAVLLVSSVHTASRYIISLVEQHVVKTQTRQRLEDRRRRVREQRAEILRRREVEGATADDEELPDENDVDEMDIEVPGWEAKGQWVLSLDLFAGGSSALPWAAALPLTGSQISSSSGYTRPSSASSLLSMASPSTLCAIGS
jgi:E3 ubiquitin-protein ligase synoviolin